MDFRAVLAVVSAAAGIVLVALGLAKAFLRKPSPAVLWIYGLLFFVAAIALWNGRRIPYEPAPMETLILPEPVEAVKVEQEQTSSPTPTRRKHHRPRPPVQDTPEEQLYQAISRLFDAIEDKYYSSERPASKVDSVPVPTISAPARSGKNPA